jgi:hypothetical protein
MWLGAVLPQIHSEQPGLGGAPGFLAWPNRQGQGALRVHLEHETDGLAQVRYHTFKHSEAPSAVQIKTSELEDRAKDLEHYDLDPFFKSALFKTNGYKYADGVITKSFASDDL